MHYLHTTELIHFRFSLELWKKTFREHKMKAAVKNNYYYSYFKQCLKVINLIVCSISCILEISTEETKAV